MGHPVYVVDNTTDTCLPSNNRPKFYLFNCLGARGLSSIPAPLGPAGSIPAPPSPAMAKLNIATKPPPAPTGGSRQWIQF